MKIILKGSDQMDMESMMLEAFQRIKNLEKQVEELNIKIESTQNTSPSDESDKSIENITRNKAKQITMEKLKANNKDTLIRKAIRDEGGGLVLEENNNLIYMKFYHSKSYDENTPVGWHAVTKEDLNDPKFKIYIFTLFGNEKLYTFIFTKEQLNEMILKKSIDQNERYHFGFAIEGNRAFDTRDEKIDITYALNNFNL